MPELSASQIIFLAAIIAYTSAAAIADARFRRIPNALTVPMCLAGLLYQISFFGFDGLKTAGLGFATGFGILFVLWMIGSAGGGDVKLMGGLSVWLGSSLTLKVLFVSLIFVIVGTAFAVLRTFLSKGIRGTKKQYLKPAGQKTHAETVEARARRRVMAFALPVALATWCVLGVFRNQW